MISVIQRQSLKEFKGHLKTESEFKIKTDLIDDLIAFTSKSRSRSEKMERGQKRTLSESSTGSEDADTPRVGFKMPRTQPDYTFSPPTYQRRESQASTVSSASATSVSEDDSELDGQKLSQVRLLIISIMIMEYTDV